IERVQTGLRIERNTLKVLKGLAEYLDLSLGDLVEGIVLHAFEGKAPFGPPVLAKIDQLKAVYGLTLTAADAHKLKEQPSPALPRAAADAPTMRQPPCPPRSGGSPPASRSPSRPAKRSACSPPAANRTGRPDGTRASPPRPPMTPSLEPSSKPAPTASTPSG